MSDISATSARSLRAIRPSDLAAWDSIGADVAASLVSDVIARCARLASAHAHDVSSVASLTVGRHYLVTGDRDHAVARAVRLAETTVRAAYSDDAEVATDWTEPVAMARLESWSAKRPDAIAQTNVAREAFVALLAGAEIVPERWQAIADAWLNHDPRECVDCQGQGVRPPSLRTVRAHVAGLSTRMGPGKAMTRTDGATVDAVREVLAPLVERAAAGALVWDGARGDVWDAFGVAWAMVERGDDLSPVLHASPMGEVSVLTVDAPTYLRDLTDAEVALAARPTLRREAMASHPGEGDDSATTAPNLRDVSVTTGQLKSFKPVVSPRKRSEGAATIQTTLSREVPGTPVAHDATRADRYAARLLAGRRATLVAQGADLPPLD